MGPVWSFFGASQPDKGTWRDGDELSLLLDGILVGF